MWQQETSMVEMAESPLLLNSTGWIQKAAFLLLVGAAGSALISVAISAILLAFAILATILQWREFKRNLVMPPSILWAAAALFLWTVAATLAGGGSLQDQLIKKCWLFSILLLAPVFIRGERQVKALYHSIFAFAAISAASGIVQFAWNPQRDDLNRIKGFMSIWMTFSGSLMLALVGLIAYAIAFGWKGKKTWWVIPAATLLSLSLWLSQTRSAWVGACIGITLILIVKRPRLLVVFAAMLLALYAASPDRIQRRFRAAFDPADPNTRNRIEISYAAFGLIGDHPWIGVGQKVSIIAPHYRMQSNYQYPDWMFIHMHNNFLQIAAERGLPGLAIWMWFIFQLGWQAFKVYRSPRASETERFAGMAAIGALAALLTAGMFEYNYGDSEILVVFLFVMSAPHSIQRNQRT
jgi:O-antigen ligase